MFTRKRQNTRKMARTKNTARKGTGTKSQQARPATFSSHKSIKDARKKSAEKKAAEKNAKGGKQSE